MNFLKIRGTCRIATVLAIILVFSLALAEEKKSPTDQVAVVNGVIIKQQELDRELDFYLKRSSRQRAQIPDLQFVKIKKEILESLIDRELLYQESQKKGIDIKAQAISKQLTSIKQRYPNEVEFEKALRKMNLSETDVRSQIKQGMSIQRLIDQEVTQKIVVTDEESKAYYDANPKFFKQPEEVKASHILIKVDADATEAQKSEARQKIKNVQQKLKSGEDFALLAKEFSQGPSSVKGGDLGYFRRGQMVKSFEDAAFSLKLNEVSDIVETRFGYHLIKVVDKKPEKIFTYMEVKDRLNQRIKQQKVEKEAGIYINKLKEDAKIEKSL